MASCRGVAVTLVVGVLVGACDGYAASRSRTATASVNVTALAKLSLSASVVSFPDANPDLTPVIQASGAPVTITAKVRTTPGSTVTLSVLASDDLAAGTARIPATAVGWTGGGAGFVSGTMSTTVARAVASWTGSGSRSGTQAFTLANSWTYATGSYNATFVYTLTAP